MKPAHSEDPDVIVVGAGAAGVSAAVAMADAGLAVTIVEARDRTGGRIFTLQDPEHHTPIEFGAEFIHGKSPEVWSLLEAWKVQILFDRIVAGRKKLSRSGYDCLFGVGDPCRYPTSVCLKQSSGIELAPTFRFRVGCFYVHSKNLQSAGRSLCSRIKAENILSPVPWLGRYGKFCRSALRNLPEALNSRRAQLGNRRMLSERPLLVDRRSDEGRQSVR
ncbi:MAG: FAD-dependent oxidoreductase [Candidatus Sulfotelmatobacter sp.]|jgi:hypothetical protein